MPLPKGAPPPGILALAPALALTAAVALASPVAARAQSASGTLTSFQPHFGSSSLSSLEQPFNASTNTNLALTAGLVGTYPQTGSTNAPVTGAGDSYSGVGGEGAPNTSGGYPANANSRPNNNDGSAGTALNGKVNLNGGQ